MCIGCGAIYYGETSRNPKIHVNEHLGIGKSGFLLTSPNSSAIWEHIKETGQDEALDDFNVINRTCNSFDHLTHESLPIHRNDPRLNSKQSSIPLILF